MDVDVDAAGRRFGWFLEGYDKKAKMEVYRRRVLMDTAGVSRMAGEAACAVYAVLPNWRSEIEANLAGTGAVDWEANDYFIGPAQLRGLDVADSADVRRYSWLAPP